MTSSMLLFSLLYISLPLLFCCFDPISIFFQTRPSGGHDISPSLYGERIKKYCGPIIPERGEQDLEITRYAYKIGKPILAICRGIQLLNLSFGGTIYQDLEQEGFECHSIRSTPRDYPVHHNFFKKGSILYSVFGDSLRVNSLHHQAIQISGEGIDVTAHSDDGVPEGIEVSGGNPFIVGVQWHPEMMFTSKEQMKLFEAFVNAALHQIS